MHDCAIKLISRRLVTGVTIAAATGLAWGLAGMPAGAWAQTGPTTVVLEFTNLATLDEDNEGHYEGWAIVDGAPISTGNFNINEAGQPVTLGTGELIDEFDAGVDISSASDIKISLEPATDSDPAPSGLIVLGGMVSGGQADLATGLEAVATTTGTFILATPSDNEVDETNDNQGIWFLEMPGPVPGFVSLPDVGPNWVYEGWVVDFSGEAPMPYSTGTFTMAEGFDSDMAGPMGGGPPFPGQDFVAYQGGPVLDLDSGDFAAVVSIEPVPDNSPAPFQFKPLATMIPTDALGMNNAMTNQTEATFPYGSAVLGGSVATESVSWGEVKRAYR